MKPVNKGENKMKDLYFTENWTENVKFSIKIKEKIYSGKSKFQQIDFYDSYEFGRFFTLDGYMMANEKDEFIYHEMITHVPMASNLNIKKVLVIGGGDGGTVRELTRYNNIEEIHMVEIDERVVRLCQQYLPLTSNKLEDPRVKLLFQDGLDYVAKIKDNSYDLIIVDSTDPISVGEGLFTEEFYMNCYRILNEKGILINQHESPYFKVFSDEMKKAHSKIKKIFPIAKVYQFHMPTYASGHWLFGFASKSIDPIEHHNKKEWKALELETKYYNSDIHQACFSLPNYVKTMLENT